MKWTCDTLSMAWACGTVSDHIRGNTVPLLVLAQALGHISMHCLYRLQADGPLVQFQPDEKPMCLNMLADTLDHVVAKHASDGEIPPLPWRMMFITARSMERMCLVVRNSEREGW